jgi:hypothetical protein
VALLYGILQSLNVVPQDRRLGYSHFPVEQFLRSEQFCTDFKFCLWYLFVEILWNSHESSKRGEFAKTTRRLGCPPLSQNRTYPCLVIRDINVSKCKLMFSEMCNSFTIFIEKILGDLTLG